MAKGRLPLVPITKISTAVVSAVWRVLPADVSQNTGHQRIHDLNIRRRAQRRGP